MRLRARFALLFVGACILALGLASVLSYRLASQSALADIRHEAALIHANALAVRGYTAEELSELLRHDVVGTFLPHSVPSFAAHSVFARFAEIHTDYRYKEAVLNPTNPKDLADPWEADLIQQLRSDPSIDRLSLVREIDDDRFYTVAYPIVIRDMACLECHSTPDRAPAELIAVYGSENGFGWELNEIIGAQIISTPMEVAEERIFNMLWVLLASVAVALMIVLVLTIVIMTRMVIVPVQRMSEIAEKVSLGDSSVPEYERPGQDEVASLSRSFNRMRRSLDRAMKMLE